MVNLNITSAATMLSEAHDSGLIPSDSPLLIILYPLLIIIAFVGLAVVCDEILEPTLEELSISLRIPHDVAAATFLSLGSSAPEISMSCLATYRGKIELSLGATLGSAIIAFSVIPALCVFASEGKVLHLEIVPLLRDVGFFVISILMFVGFLSFSNGAITQLQSGIMVSFFFVYLASMMVLSKYYGNDDEDDKQSAPQHHVLDQVHRQRTGSILSQPRTRAISKDGNARRGSIDGDAETAALVNGNKSISNGKKELNGATSNGATYGTNGHAHNHHEDGDGDADRSRSGSNGSSSSSDIYVPVIGTILHYISVPYRWLIGVVLYPFLGSEGTDNEEGIKRFWPVVLVVSIAFISLLSDVILVLTTKFADAVNLPHNVAGLTILALGAQVPDTFASIAVARGGEGPSAIANAIGSQNLDILVGIGLPFFIYSAATGQSVSISSKSMDDSGANIDQHGVTLIGIGLGILVFVFLILSLRYYIQSKMKKPRRGSVSAEIQEQEVIKPSLQVSDAIVLLSLYVILTAIVVLDQVKL